MSKLNVNIPPAIQDAIMQNIGGVAQMGEFEDWQRLVAKARTLSPSPDEADEQSNCYLDCIGLVWAIEREDLPLVLFALRVGLTACEAFRNEIDAAKLRDNAGNN